MKNNFELLTNKDKIKPLGRYQILNDGIGCDHCATGIEFSVLAIGDIELTLFTTIEKEYCDSTFFTVYVDGVRTEKRLEAPLGEQTVTVATFFDREKHIVKIVKQSESNYNLCILKALSFDGELLEAPPRLDKYIEYKSPCIEELYELCGLK